MSVIPLHDRSIAIPQPQGHLIGFVRTYGDCVEICHELNEAGFSNSDVSILYGDDGIYLFLRMMGDGMWGDLAKEFLRQGLVELDRGHCVLMIDVTDREQAVTAADLAIPRGGYGFTYFGHLVDQQLGQ